MHFLLFLLPTETHPAATHTTVTSTAPVHHNTYDGINTVRLRYRLTELGSIIMGRRKKSKANRRPLMASQERPGQRGEDDIAVLDECGDANLPSLYDGDDLPSEDVMPESEVKLLVEFVLEACEDCSGKWITKHMPVTTRALKAGIFPGGKFMVKFKKKFDEIAWKKEMAGCESRSHIPVEPNSRNVVFFDARAIAQKAVPIRLARQAGCTLAVYARNLRLFETALFELAQNTRAVILRTANLACHVGSTSSSWRSTQPVSTLAPKEILHFSGERMACSIENAFSTTSQKVFSLYL